MKNKTDLSLILQWICNQRCFNRSKNGSVNSTIIRTLLLVLTLFAGSVVYADTTFDLNNTSHFKLTPQRFFYYRYNINV